MVGATLWADGGLRDSATKNTPSLHKQALDVPDGSFSRELVEALIRAAYTNGYTTALSDPEPLTYAAAMSFRDQLQLALPV